jgi:hypothetical protein
VLTAAEDKDREKKIPKGSDNITLRITGVMDLVQLLRLALPEGPITVCVSLH